MRIRSLSYIAVTFLIFISILPVTYAQINDNKSAGEALADTSRVTNKAIPAAKQEKPEDFAIRLEAGAGLSNKFTETFKKTFNNPAFSLRLLLKMNRKLNVGLHSGYMLLKKDNVKDGGSGGNQSALKASLTANPYIFIFNMKVVSLDLCGGLGVNRLISDLTAFNRNVVTERWYYVFYASLGYTYYFTNRFGLGLEADIYSFTSIKNEAATAKLKIAYDIYKW